MTALWTGSPSGAQHVLTDVRTDPGVTRSLKRPTTITSAAADVEKEARLTGWQLEELQGSVCKMPLCCGHPGIRVVLGGF
mmetsp:Transcript_8358/g.18645  ORF Transcript_8358/g.18645 Transcript_8358/m.18645 type:complete len:80 (+) Transcript_8358:293-532(+)